MKLEERLEALEKQIDEQNELQAINEQLLAELEKRDQAVEQAVTIIIGLEEKNDRLIQERNAVRSIHAETSFYLSDYTDGASSQNVASSPPSVPRRVVDNDATPVRNRKMEPSTRTIARMPSFLSEQTEETEALRSLYLPRDQSVRALPKLSEDNDTKDNDGVSELDGMNSPRLSVLSESSFLSVYGKKGNDQDLESLDLNSAEQVDLPDTVRHRKSSSVDQWVGEGLNHLNQKDRKVSGPRRTSGVIPGQFLSMNDVVKSPLQRLEKLQRTLERRNKPLISARLFQNSPDGKAVDPPRSVPMKKDSFRRTDVESFDDNRGLPPTPDTFSTNTLQQYKASSDTLNGDASSRMSSQLPEFEGDRSYLNRAHTGPEYMQARLRRPRSAAETITSRREGHGWDTATQSEATETNSDFGSAITSTLDPWITIAREYSVPAALQPPELFSFGADRDKDWGRDMMFSRRDSDIPIRPRNKFESNSDPRSDDTAVPSRRFERSASAYSRDGQHLPQGSVDADASYRPAPPERRSSLAASPIGNEKRLRRLQQAQAAAQASAFYSDAPVKTNSKGSPQKGQDGEQSKRGLLKMFGIGRSVSAVQPPPAFNFSQSYNEQGNSSGNDKSGQKNNNVPQDLHDFSATPPPISRYPRGRNGGLERTVDARRPSTSHSLESRPPVLASGSGRKERRLSTGHVAGSSMSGTYTNANEGTEQQEDHTVRDTASTRAKKWYTLGRSGSLRK